MINRVLNNFYIQLVAAILIIMGTVLCIFPPDTLFFKWQANFSVQIMGLYLAFGLIFLLLRQEKLVYVSFINCAILCMFLQNPDGGRSFYSTPNNEQAIEVAHFSLPFFDGEMEDLVKTIRESGADLVSLQELTPDWNFALRDQLSDVYPHNKTVNRIDFHGMAVYSKHPFVRIDTFMFEGEVPNIIGSVEIDSTHGEIYFISSHTTPPVNHKAYELIDKHLQVVADYALGIRGPVLTFGGYNMVPWAPELQAFRMKSKLSNARRGFTPTSQGISMPFMQIPLDHIYYSNDFECVAFNSIGDEEKNSLGIKGKLQFKYKYVKGTAK